MRKKKLYLLFVFLLILNSVNAQENFNLISNTEISLCPCSNQAYSIQLQNLGATAGNYQIVSSGTASDWIKVSPSKFSLNPGTAANVIITVNSPCNIKEEADLNIFAVSSSGLTKTLTQKLNFLACYDYDISLGDIQDFEEDTESVSYIEHEGSFEVCGETKKVMPVLIENKESYGNIYEVALKGAHWASLNVNEFQLQGNQRGLVLITLEPPKDSNNTYILTLDAATKLGENKKSAEIDLIVDNCFQAELDITKSTAKICGGDLETYEVNVKNKGKFTETLNLGVEGPEFAAIKEELQLDPNEEKTTKLEIKTSKDEKGDFNVKVIASNENIIAQDDISLEVIQRKVCYNTIIGFRALLKNRYSHEIFPVSVSNRGLEKESYEVSIDGPSWVSIIPNELELNPEQKGNINLNIDPNEDVKEGNYEITIKAESVNEVYSKKVNIELKKENPMLRKIKGTIKFYQYYLYLLIFIIIIILIFWSPIKKQIKKRKQEYEKKKERERKRRELEEARKLKKLQKEKEKQKKLEQKKKSEKIKEEKKPKRKKPYLITVIILILFAALIFIGTYFNLFEKLPKNIYYPLLNFVYGGYANLYYIILGIILSVAIILILNRARKKKERKVKVKAKKPGKKEIKKKSKFFKNIFVRIIIPVLIAILIAFIFYGENLFNTIKDFAVLYFYYFIAGFLILIILIFIIKFYKPILDFLLEEDKKK